MHISLPDENGKWVIHMDRDLDSDVVVEVRMNQETADKLVAAENTRMSTLNPEMKEFQINVGSAVGTALQLRISGS